MGMKRIVKKALGEMGFAKDGGIINWFPGHMAAATRAIKNRLKIPLSSAHPDLQPQLSAKRRVIALNKKDLANPNILNKWVQYFDLCKQDCIAINAHSRSSVKKLLDLVELKLKEVIAREPTLLVMVVGVPNVGKSALINSIHQIALSHFPVQEKTKRATVGPLPGVTQDIAGFKIAHRPSIYVLDTPGVLVPSIPDIETGLKLALAGSVKDSVVGEERITQYLLAVLNIRGTPLHWSYLSNRTEVSQYASDGKHEYNIKVLLPKRRKPPNGSDVLYIQDLVTEVQRSLYETLNEFTGNVEDEHDLESLIEQQFEVLQKALKIPHKATEARLMVSKKFLTLFRTGKLGPFVLDDVPDSNPS
ncbi:short integuments 2, mitochondrial isoform X2 [Mangifera indica]|uniref:short integuments 2, mitochondrial isoform X2 n=1 Tax=Mangifera indica TaxID=29780 RepID=UPI001CFB9D94|nr:short integuments 2, mitochondrial isoform X2 [Mangifera indica]